MSDKLKRLDALSTLLNQMLKRQIRALNVSQEHHELMVLLQKLLTELGEV